MLAHGPSLLSLQRLNKNINRHCFSALPSSLCRRQVSCRVATAMPSAEELRGQSCSLLGGCSSDTPRLSAEELAPLMAALPGWQLSDDQKAISRSFTAKNFVAAIDFFNAVKEVAEAEGHHPDLHLTNYRDVLVVLSTHAIKGLSMLDMVMAAKIDAVPVQYSPKWEREHKAMLAARAAAAAAGSS